MCMNIKSDVCVCVCIGNGAALGVQLLVFLGQVQTADFHLILRLKLNFVCKIHDSHSNNLFFCSLTMSILINIYAS